MQGGSSASSGVLKLHLVERLSDLERLIALEQARSTPDTALIRRLGREKNLARDRMAVLGGSGMPRWAQVDVAD